MLFIDREIQRELVDVLANIPRINQWGTDKRDFLLEGLPQDAVYALTRDDHPRIDLKTIVTEVVRWGRLDDGEWAISILIQNALDITRGTQQGRELDKLLKKVRAATSAKISSDEDNVKKHEVDFAIITALEVEHQAIINRLDYHERVRDEKIDIWTYDLGKVSIPNSDQAYKIVVVLLPDMGPDPANVAANDIMRRWKPKNIIMVGIAGGVRQHDDREWQDGDLELGDVVVAESIQGYEYTKEFEKIQQSRARGYPTSRLLLERAWHVQDAQWTEKIRVPRPKDSRRPKPKRFIGLIASGNKVIASKKFIKKLVALWPQLLAVEMEGVGVATAAFYRPQVANYLVVRGISDWADERKNIDQTAGWREYAANSAAAYVMAFLRDRPVDPVGSDNPS